MIVFVASAVSALLVAVLCYQVYKDASVPDKPKELAVPLLLGSAMLSLCTGCFTGSMTVEMLMLELMPAVTGMLLYASSLYERKSIRPVLIVLSAAYVLPLSLHVAAAAGWIIAPAGPVLLYLYLACVLVLCGIFVAGICRRLKNVKMILKTGTIWVNVALAVDSVYLVLFLSMSLCYVCLSVMCPSDMRGLLLIFPVLSGLLTAALGVRVADDVMFVFWRNQERRIVESMKVTKVETAVDPAGIDDVYQDIYERIVAYFEAEKPYLDSELTINDLGKVLYSNKLYISRAISQFTGRNFCQFVNYYRITHSMEMFRNNHELKIHELASGSGFNSDVSYNMAFRLFMGETPGEWCRKERSRKIKMKK